MNTVEQHERFEAWIRDHGAILHHVANGFADGDDRNDLMQELLLALWKAVPAFRSHAQPSTYIYRVSHNAALTWKRTQGNYKRKIERYQAEPVIPPATSGGQREQFLLDQLYAAIRRLPPVDRSLVLLMLDGLSYSEIAEIHGLSESNIGVRIHRLKQKLTELTKGIQYEP